MTLAAALSGEFKGRFPEEVTFALGLKDDGGVSEGGLGGTEERQRKAGMAEVSLCFLPSTNPD